MHEAEDPAVRRQRPKLRREGGGGAQGESGRKKKQTPGHQGVSSANRVRVFPSDSIKESRGALH